MSFLNPILLAGLAAVSVPIIIHLLNRRKFQKVAWAAMRFLQLSVEQNQRRMRVEDLILLILRCLLLALLALALARPAFLSRATDLFGQSKVTGVLVLDNSLSMGMSDGTSTRFDKAKAAAEQILDSMPAGSAMAVFLASDIANGVIPEPTFDLNLARKTIREAPLTDRASDMFPSINTAINTLQDRLALRREVYAITDGQSAGWRQLVDIQKLLERSKTEIKSHLIFVNEHETKNLAVSGLRLASGLSPARYPLRFEVRVTNDGLEEARDVHVSLTLNQETPNDEFTIDSIAPGATRSISLFCKLPSAGYHVVSARIPEDRLPADDRRALAVRAISQARVLLVDGDPGQEARESETYFVRHALVPVPADHVQDYFIRTATIAAPELSQARLDDFDAIILANVPEFTETTLSNFEQYLRRGGGLIVFPGGRINRDHYNEHLFNRHKFLPAPYGAPRGDETQDEQAMHLQDKDYQHSIVSLWNDPAAGTLASARFFRFFPLEPASKTNTASQPNPNPNPKPAAATPAGSAQARDVGDPNLILQFADATPAVMERNWGLGRVIQFSSTADTAWNDLAVRPTFVPLLYRALGAIVQRQDEGLNVRVGDTFQRRLSLEYLGKDATLVKPGQSDAVRDLRRIELLDGWPQVQYRQTDTAGAYEASILEPPLNLKFAAQADAGESSLDELSPDQLATLRDVAAVVDWKAGVDLKPMVEQDRTGLELWLPLIVLAFALAVLETFLAQWFSRSK